MPAYANILMKAHEHYVHIHTDTEVTIQVATNKYIFNATINNHFLKTLALCFYLIIYKVISLDNYFLKFSLVHKMAYSLVMVKSINTSYILQRALHFICELVHNISIEFKGDIHELSIYRYLVPQSNEHIDYSIR